MCCGMRTFLLGRDWKLIWSLMLLLRIPSLPLGFQYYSQLSAYPTYFTVFYHFVNVLYTTILITHYVLSHPIHSNSTQPILEIIRNHRLYRCPNNPFLCTSRDIISLVAAKFAKLVNHLDHHLNRDE